MSVAASWRPSLSGPTRYDELVLPAGVPRVTLGEGGTPIVSAGAAQLKCDHLNPTGSYKDRIAAVGISVGAAAGATGWVGTSSGNAGAAFAAYGARAGLPGRLVTVEGVVPEKLGQVLAFGVEVCEVDGFGCGRTSRRASSRRFGTSPSRRAWCWASPPTRSTGSRWPV